MGRYKEAKAYLVEKIIADCPHCENEIIINDPGWRYKPGDDGKSYMPIRCSKCRTIIRLNFLK